MRKLMWFTIGFGAACGCYAYLNLTMWLIPCAAIALFGAVGMQVLTGMKKQFRIGCAVFMGLTAGFLWTWCFESVYLSPARALDEKIQNVTIEARDYTYSTKYGTAVQGSLKYDGKSYQVKVYLNSRQTLVPGDQVVGPFRFHSSVNETYRSGNGNFLVAYQRGKSVVHNSRFLKVQDLPSYLRMRLDKLIDCIFPDDTASFAKALFLGIGHELDYETDTALKISGIRHVIAVSGLHISVLWALIYSLMGKKRALATFIGIPVLLTFAAIAGFRPSVVRACVVQILIMTALLLNREPDPLTSLSFAALLLLIINPFVITSVSFQLSFGCVSGILLFSPKIYDWIMGSRILERKRKKKWPDRFIKSTALSVSVSAGAALLTTPLVALYFGTVSLVSIFTNLLVLWAVPLAFYGIILSCSVGLFWVGAAKTLAGSVSWLIRYILWIAGSVSRFPLAAVYTVSDYVAGWLILSGIGIVIFMISRKKHPACLCAGIVLGLFTALFLSWLEPLQGECRLTVVDVGQGQCVLLQSEGKTFIVDCGGSYDENAADSAAELLLSQGIRRIDGAIMTHYDHDHVGGLTMLMSRLPANQIFLPAYDPNNQEQTELISELQHQNFMIVRRDYSFSFGDAKLQIFSSTRDDVSNESGLCVLFQTQNCDILITGDRGSIGELELMQHIDLPQLEVLVVGHHGSKYSSSDALLNKTRPTVAIISVGEKNHYGHPAAEVLQRLEDAGSKVYRTDRDGTVIYKG